MRLQQPNRWSCLPTAFAMAVDISVKEFIRRIGHDGSKIAFPTQPEPTCRRGFHIQECIHVAHQSGYAVTPIELFPRHAPSLSVEPVTVLFGDEETNLERFAAIVNSGRGVITGHGRHCCHAVAYNRGTIYDPNGSVYRFSPSKCESEGFIGTCAWNVNAIHQNLNLCFNIHEIQPRIKSQSASCMRHEHGRYGKRPTLSSSRRRRRVG